MSRQGGCIRSCADNWPTLLWKFALQKESEVEEGRLMPDHVHMLPSIPPKYAVSQVVGYIKGKSAIHLARIYRAPLVGPQRRIE